jgi:hypothetical protein
MRSFRYVAIPAEEERDISEENIEYNEETEVSCMTSYLQVCCCLLSFIVSVVCRL